MSVIESWPDVEGAMRAWLRSRTEITALVGQHVFFGAPDDATESDYPMIVISRVGGGNDLSEAPIDLPTMQLTVWAPLRRKDTATAVKNVLKGVLGSIRSPTTVVGFAVLYGAEVNTDVWLPDPADNRPGYMLTVEVTARAI